ncbi:MAG: hypothetical protein NDJ89_01690 [Oligoflexia bacterium]|nr:hypothetical protein [Oligoflexia bacterium]
MAAQSKLGRNPFEKKNPSREPARPAKPSVTEKPRAPGRESAERGAPDTEAASALLRATAGLLAFPVTFPLRVTLLLLTAARAAVSASWRFGSGR